jgi:hypothetical protein
MKMVMVLMIMPLIWMAMVSPMVRTEILFPVKVLVRVMEEAAVEDSMMPMVMVSMIMLRITMEMEFPMEWMKIMIGEIVRELAAEEELVAEVRDKAIINL